MIIGEEVQIYIPYAPKDSSESIAYFIQNLYKRRYTFIDESEYIEEVTRILERIGTNYNPELGHLVRYAKNTLSLKLKDYATRSFRHIEQFTEEDYSVLDVDKLMEHELTKYSDNIIKAIYNVINGRGSKRDLKIIADLFDVREQ